MAIATKTEWAIGNWEQRAELEYVDLSQEINGRRKCHYVRDEQTPIQTEYDSATGVLYIEFCGIILRTTITGDTANVKYDTVANMMREDDAAAAKSYTDEKVGQVEEVLDAITGGE